MGTCPAATILFARALAEPQEAAPLQAEAKAGPATGLRSGAYEVRGTWGA